MKENITRDFNGATEKGIEIYYNDSLGQFEIETPEGEGFSIYDEMNEEGDGSNGLAAEKVREFIKNY